MTGDHQTVSIVDDDTAVVKSLDALLRSHGYHTTTFPSADAYLREVDGHKRGVLLLDVRMPGMNGLELQSELIERSIDLPIVFITAHGDVPMAIEAIRAGAVDFIEKPFTDDTLLAAIERAVDQLSAKGEREQDQEGTAEQLACLTAREFEVFNRLVLGETNKAIALTLGISQRTVEVHRGRIKEKLKARSLADLIRLKEALPANGKRDASA